MTNHANELRWHANKIGHPAGDTPAVMRAAADYIDELERRLSEAENDTGRLNFLERRQLEIDSSGGWNEEPTFGVTRVSGGRNDRKWTCLARGETLREAIDASMQPAKGD